MSCRKQCVAALLVTITDLLMIGGALAAESVRFSTQSVKVGDRTHQQIQFDLDLEMTIEMSGQKVDTSAQIMQRQQQYRMTVLEHQRGNTTKVRLTFDQAQQSVTNTDQSKQKKMLPVSGKTYLVARTGEELQITDPEGNKPSPAEIETVRNTCETIGQSNPLAEFLKGRTVRVAERLKLPSELAEKLFGFGQKVGEVKRFNLTLASVSQIGGVECAVFDTDFEARSKKDGEMSMRIKGQMVLQVNTCRNVYTRLAGPISILEVRGPLGGQFHVRTAGTINVAHQAQFPTKRF